MAEHSRQQEFAGGVMSASTSRQDNFAVEENVQDDVQGVIAGWLRDQQGAQSYDRPPGDGTASRRNQDSPPAAGGTTSRQSQEQGAQQYGRVAEDELSSWPPQDEDANDEDDFSEPESGRMKPARLAIFYFVMVMFGVGGALAWRALPLSSTIGSATRAAMAWSAPPAQPVSAAVTAPAPSTTQPSRADLAQRIDALTNQIGVLQQQVSQLNAAHAESAKTLAEEQLKVLALQKVVEQSTQGPPPKSPPVVNVARPPASPKPHLQARKPHPQAKSEASRSGAGMPLRLNP